MSRKVAVLVYVLAVLAATVAITCAMWTGMIFGGP